MALFFSATGCNMTSFSNYLDSKIPLKILTFNVFGFKGSKLDKEIKFIMTRSNVLWVIKSYLSYSGDE